MISRYKKIRPLLQTGDVVLFRGRGIISGLILLFCRLFNRFKGVKFSHIGMVVVDSGRVMIFESTTLFGCDSTYPNPLSGSDGVQLNPLSERLQTYKGKVFIRQLICERGRFFEQTISDSLVELLGRPYEKSLIELMGAAAEIINLFDGHKSDLSTIFCSELISEIFKRQRFLSQSIPPNEYNPSDYDFGGRVDEELYFSEKEVRLAKVVRIK